MNSRPKDPKTARNKNVLIVGGSGSGKTRFWLKPNLLQCTSKTYPTSFVVTDPKGDIVVSCGHALQKNGYQIKILNSLNFKKSKHYNPFAYIHSEKDILKLVTTLIANTKGEGKAGDDFWVKAETLLYTALIGYIHYEAPVEEQNFSTLIEFINAMEVREDDEDFKNPVDLMFEELKKRKPDHFAVRQYAKFKLSAGKTAKSILISCSSSCPIRMIPLTFSFPCAIPSFSTCFVKRRMMCTADACRFMSAASLTRPRISGRYRGLKSW